MKITKRIVILIAAITVLVVTNVAIAAWTLTQTLSITGGVQIDGNIQLYNADGTTVISSFDFAKFTTAGTKTLLFRIKNTGNVPAKVVWDITNPSITWTLDYDHFKHDVGSDTKYTLTINKQSPLTGTWAPNPSSVTATDKEITLAPGNFAPLAIDLYYSGTPYIAEDLSLTLSFTATNV